MSPTQGQIRIIMGLGNPGVGYARTRHNAGYRVIDRLLAVHPPKKHRKRFKGDIFDTEIGGRRVILVKPLTFMNNSGECATKVLGWYRVPPEELLVIYDDIDLPAGRLRIRPTGSAGTHNGMRSLTEYLGEDFVRLRIGVGKPPPEQDLYEYVLSAPGEQEAGTIVRAEETAAEAAEMILTEGMESAMRQYNGLVLP